MSRLTQTVPQMAASALAVLDPTGGWSEKRQSLPQMLAALHNLRSSGADMSHRTTSLGGLLAALANAVASRSDLSGLNTTPAELLTIIRNAQTSDPDVSRQTSTLGDLWDGALELTGALLPFGSVGVYAGDSITANGALYTTAGAGSVTHGSKGFATWAQALSDGRLSIGAAGNQGVSGDQSSQLWARFENTTTQAPAVTIIEIGTNDVAAVTTAGSATTIAATCISNIQSMIDALRAINCRIILFKILPYKSTSSPMTANQIAAWEAINTWIAQQATSDVRIIDTEPIIGNGTADHSMKDGHSNGDDFTHPNAKCAKLVGGLVATTIAAWVMAGTLFPANNNDPTDLIPNSQLTGTGGALSGATGVVATSFTLQGSTAGGATVVGAKVARAAGLGEFQQVTISGTYTGNTRSVSLQQTVDLTGVIDTGDVFRLAWEVEFDADAVSVAGVVPELNIWGGVPLVILNDGTSVPPNEVAPGPWSAAFNSQPFTLNATAAAAPKKYTAFLFIFLKNTANPTEPCSAVVRIGRPKLTKV